jgi:hypothetical protein
VVLPTDAGVGTSRFKRAQGGTKTTTLGVLARIIHEARSEDAESAADSRPSDRRPPEAYLTVRRGRAEGEGREGAVLSASAVERS